MSQKFGERYEIIRQIGGGGMAIVYLAKDLFLDRDVAVKVLRDEFVESDEFIRRFHKEAKAVASLNHQNIVSVYDFDASSTPIYLVMEYVEGKTLKEKILDEGHLSEQMTIQIATQIANGLALAHSNKIIHKDIKSQNILIDVNNLVKITDFGIAQILSNSTITHNKGILGSAHYFSPEQARGEMVTYKSDIYSLGVVMYEMLTGELPFTGDNPVTVALKHIQEKPLPPSAINSSVTPEMEAVVLKCLSKHPDARFDSMESLLKALNGIRNSKSYQQIVSRTYVENDNKYDMDSTLALPKNMTQKLSDFSGYKKTNTEEITLDKKSSKKIAIPILLAISVFCTLITILAITIFSGNDRDIVPSVVNLTYEQAESLLQSEDLILEKSDERYDDTVPKGQIIEQNPTKGEKKPFDKKVKVIMSLGSEAFSVASFVGDTQEVAENKIAKKGLKSKLTYENNDNYERNIVIRQSPVAGSEVSKGDVIELVISLGSNEVLKDVPDLRGQQQDAAKQLLINAGLRVGGITTAEDSTKADGEVVTQSIPPNTKVKKNTYVSFTINKLPLEDKIYNFSYTVPSDAWVTIEQTDSKGTQTIYEIGSSAGEVIDKEIHYTGTGTIKVYLDKTLAKEEKLT